MIKRIILTLSVLLLPLAKLCPVFAETSLERLSNDWSATFIFEDNVYREIFLGLQMSGDAFLMLGYGEVAKDDIFKAKVQKLEKDGLAKITADKIKNKAVPYILSDLISNEILRQTANAQYKKLAWGAPLILMRAVEARDHAIKAALLNLDKETVLTQLSLLKKKITPDNDLSELSTTVDDLIQSVKDHKGDG